MVRFSGSFLEELLSQDQKNITFRKKYDFISSDTQGKGRGLSDLKNFDNFLQCSLEWDCRCLQDLPTVSLYCNQQDLRTSWRLLQVMI